MADPQIVTFPNLDPPPGGDLADMRSTAASPGAQNFSNPGDYVIAWPPDAPPPGHGFRKVGIAPSPTSGKSYDIYTLPSRPSGTDSQPDSAPGADAPNAPTPANNQPAPPAPANQPQPPPAGQQPLTDVNNNFSNNPVGSPAQSCPAAAFAQGFAEGFAESAATAFLVAVLAPELIPVMLIVGAFTLGYQGASLYDNWDKLPESERWKRLGKLGGGVVGGVAGGEAGGPFGEGPTFGEGPSAGMNDGMPVPNLGSDGAPPADPGGGTDGPVPGQADAPVEQLDPNDVRFSQNTAGGRGRADALRKSMGENGWQGDPVDGVRTPDGVTTIDNTRVAVAREQGIESIPVRVHEPGEPLPPDMQPGPDGTGGRFGSAKTWGEALANRTANQKPPLPPTGTDQPPRMPKPKPDN